MPRMATVTGALLGGALAAGASAGCSYHPGSFAYGYGPGAVFAGQRAVVGCLDLAIARHPDYEGSPVLKYRFGNRCGRAISIDLRAVAVVGRLADGREVALEPYDPRHEIRRVLLAGRLAGGESLAYPTPGPVTQICVDAATLGGPRPGGVPGRWMCFATRDDVAASDAPDDAPGQDLATPEGQATPDLATWPDLAAAAEVAP